MKKYLVSVLVTLTTCLVCLTPISPSKALSLVVKEGAECTLIEVESFPDRIDRLYLWDKKTNTLIHYKCTRNDTKPTPSGNYWTCESRVAKKYLIKTQGPKCVWRKNLNPKTKKPFIFKGNPNVGASCLDAAGDGNMSSLFYVKDNELVGLVCRKTWQLLEGTPSKFTGMEGTNKNSSNSDTNKLSADLTKACSRFSSDIVTFSRTARYATTMFEMQQVRRALAQSASLFVELSVRDKTLVPLNTAVGIMIRHTESQVPGGSGYPVSADILRMAVDTFNSWCKTSIYISP